MDQYAIAFQEVLRQARAIVGISEDERGEFYEPIKAVVYDMLRSGVERGQAVAEAVCWLRQNVQINQSATRTRAPTVDIV